MMTDAVTRTQQLERVFLPVADLEPNTLNPNEMSDAEFSTFRLQLIADFEYKDGKLYRNLKSGPKVAGSFNPVTGRCTIRWRYRLYTRATLIWVMMKGEWPTEIDHKNQDPGDDHIDNLMNGTHQSNMKNVPMRSINKSGVVGVCWHVRAKKWMAFIKVDDKQKYLGLFTSFDKAVAKRLQAAQMYGYSPLHGRML